MDGAANGFVVGRQVEDCGSRDGEYGDVEEKRVYGRGSTGLA